MKGDTALYEKNLLSHFRDIVLQCLDDKDESIRLRALDLIVGMVGNSHH